MVSGLAIAHVPLASISQGSLIVDSTDFPAGGNENAASIIQSVGVGGQHAETEQRASPETAKCVIERPELV